MLNVQIVIAAESSASSRESSPPQTPNLGRLSKSQVGGVDYIVNVSQDPSGIEVHREIPKEILMSVNQFQRKQKKGTIDVWWLYDDGGLTMLIPFILTSRSQWSNCRLRVFALANKKDQLDREQRNMAALLNKFRIDYSDVTVIPDIVKPPQEATKKMFNDIIDKFMVDENVAGDGSASGSGSANNDEQSEQRSPLVITESENVALRDKVRT